MCSLLSVEVLSSRFKAGRNSLSFYQLPSNASKVRLQLLDETNLISSRYNSPNIGKPYVSIECPGRQKRQRYPSPDSPLLSLHSRYQAKQELQRQTYNMPFSHHSHSGQFCPGHAKDSLEDVIQTAISKKMQVFCLTEHMPRHKEDFYPEEVCQVTFTVKF